MKGIIILLLSIAVVFSADSLDGVTFKKVNRNIDLTSQFSRHSVSITAVNSGSKPTSELFLAVEANMVPHLSLLEVNDESDALLATSVGDKVEREVSGKKRSYTLYRVNLGKSLAPSASVELSARFIYTHTMKPYPTAIAQSDKQLVRYFDNHFFTSPYPVQSQTTTVKVPTARIESKSDLAPTSVKGETITYGPYEDTAAFKFSEMALHFENNAPFVTASSMVKEIEISHWGNIAVENTFTLQHDGAKLKGAFSRYDYQRSQGNAPSHVPTLKQVLPYGAADVYYRDEIGNISTSFFTTTERGLVLDLVPRFPLFGGWKFGFYMGYNLPSQYYLFTDVQNSNTYVLNITFAAVLDDISIDDLTVRVILPEGASNIEVHAPFPLDGQSTSRHYTYLDTSGRPVVIVNKKNVVSEHDQYFQVTYSFSQMALLREPFLLITAFLVFFFLIIVYVRFEFNVGAVRTHRKQHSDKIEDLLAKFKDVLDQAAEHHQAIESALNRLSSQKDVPTKQKAQLEKSTNEAYKVAAEIEALDGDLGRRARDVIRREEAKTKNQDEIQKVELLHKVRKTLSKQDYEVEKAKLEKAYFREDEELQGLLSDLVDF